MAWVIMLIVFVSNMYGNLWVKPCLTQKFLHPLVTRKLERTMKESWQRDLIGVMSRVQCKAMPFFSLAPNNILMSTRNINAHPEVKMEMELGHSSSKS